MKKILVFTDLDGTLMDAETYSYAEAIIAIKALIDRNIPVIPCTSKTHLEVIKTRKSLGISDPFIVENGSAVFFKPDYFSEVKQTGQMLDGYQYLLLGSDYTDILPFFDDWRNRYQINATGFHEMTVEQVIKLTDLSSEEAELAHKRFFSEPFILNDDKQLPIAAIEDIVKNGFRLLLGNRFYHLLGNSDKGTAVRKLSDLFRKDRGINDLITIGIGDSMNDLEMLKAVDMPVLVKKTNGNHQQGIKMDNLMLTDGIGPAGWQEAILKILKISGKD